MDLGSAGRQAIVCGARSGLGLACARALAAEGVHVVLAARSADKLAQVVAQLAAEFPAVSVRGVAVDLAAPEAPGLLLAACPEPDILVLNSGGPPAGDLRRFERADWEAALNANLISAVMLVRAVIDGMCARGFGRIVAVTSGAVKAPPPFLALSNAARAGLVATLKGLAREVARHNVTINNLMPHVFDTERLATNFTNRARQSGETEDALRAQSLARIPAGRFGDPAEFGALCASLCNARLGYLTGQSIMLDGGTFEGVL